MRKKAYIKTYGCQMNEYDTAKIADLLTATGIFEITNTPHDSDLVILNTCSIRDKATQKIFSELGRLRLLKNKNPHMLLAVGGCVSVQEKKNIFKQAPYVDIIFGPQTIHHLPNLYQQAISKKAHLFDIAAPAIEKFDYFPTPQIKGPAAYISIIEGCNKFCSYCIVPYTRGREVSRGLNDICQEVLTLVKNGVKEIHLLGQNVNAYRDPITKANLAVLIKTIAKIETIKRIRFTTSHPAAFDEALITVFAETPKLVDHLHLPIQSGSDRILKLMRRGYTCQEYRNIITKLRKVRPNISITTDFIVGFPQETDEDFALTLAIAKDMIFDASFSFIYSPRPNTSAAQMQDNLPLTQKKERLAILQEQLAKQARHYSNNMLGTTQKILVTDRAKKDPLQFSGRTANNRVVNFAASSNIIGEIVNVKITEVLANSLRGEKLNFAKNYKTN